MTKKFDGNLWKWLLANVVGNLLPEKTGATAGQVPSIDAEGGVVWTNPDTGRDVPTGGINGQALKAGADDSYGWADIREVPAGGTSGQVLSADGLGAYQWTDPAGGAGAKAYVINYQAGHFPTERTEEAGFKTWLQTNYPELFDPNNISKYSIEVLLHVHNFGAAPAGGSGGYWYGQNANLLSGGAGITTSDETMLFAVSTDASDMGNKAILDVDIANDKTLHVTPGADLSMYSYIGEADIIFTNIVKLDY